MGRSRVAGRLPGFALFALFACNGTSVAGPDGEALPEDASDGEIAPDAEGPPAGVDPPEGGDHLTAEHCGEESAHPPGTFVYVGGGGTEGRVGSSLDGLDWHDEVTTSRGAAYEGHTRNLVRGAGYGGGVFILVGGHDNAYVVTTCDGVHFRHDVLGTNGEEEPTPEFDDFLSDVAYLDGVFVAAGGAGKRITSFDHGLSFEETGSFVPGHFRAIEAGNGRFVAVGASFDRTRALSSTSEDGRSWSEPLLEGEPLDRALAFGSGVFVAIGDARCAVSEDGRRWDACALDAAGGPFGDVQFVDGRFLLSRGGAVFESDDGRTFRALGAGALPPNLVEGPEGFVFASASSRGVSGSLEDDFEAVSLPQFRALTGGFVRFEP